MKYSVRGRRYGEVAVYWDRERKYPYYKEVEGSEMSWEIEADDLEAAEKWLALNHPEYYMGACIVSEDRKNFMMNAVPCCEYGIGNFETEAARRRWATATFNQ